MSVQRRDHGPKTRDRLARLLSTDDPFDVVEAALWVAKAEYPDLDVNREMRELGSIGAEAVKRVTILDNPFARLDGLQEYLFRELGFHGNVENYDDPRNSFLNEVLARRTGIPLTLCIVFMEAARAVGFAPRGIGLPGHFVCSVTYDGRTIFVDPFHGGSVITEEDCRQLVIRSTGRPSLFRREQLEGVDGKAMIGRLLLNLKHVYLGRADYDRALSVVERLLLIAPGNSKEIRDKGFLEAHLGRPAAAIADLEKYVNLSPTAPDVESVKGRLVWLRRKLSEIN